MTGTKRLSLHGRLRMAAACPDPNAALLAEAADAIEQHEAFRQEVSDALSVYQKAASTQQRSLIWDALTRFIIAEPDPLVDVWLEAFPGNHVDDARDECAKISAALAKSGGKIVWETEQ